MTPVTPTEETRWLRQFAARLPEGSWIDSGNSVDARDLLPHLADRIDHKQHEINELRQQLEHAEQENTTLRAFVEAQAGDKLCDDPGEQSKCYLASGPFCGGHAFDDFRIMDARELLRKLDAAETANPQIQAGKC